MYNFYLRFKMAHKRVEKLTGLAKPSAAVKLQGPQVACLGPQKHPTHPRLLGQLHPLPQQRPADPLPLPRRLHRQPSQKRCVVKPPQ